MQMYNPQVFPIANHWQLRDAVLSHLVQGIHHQGILFNGLGMGSHDLGGLYLLNVGVFHQHTTQVTIGDDAQKLFILHHHSGTQTLVGHLNDDTSEAVVRSDLRTFVPDVQIFYTEIELLAQGTTRMELGEVLRRKAATPH